jgi:hypothetical protein
MTISRKSQPGGPAACRARLGIGRQ